jgi:asparagine synthase (glutamine-hydrolysing)
MPGIVGLITKQPSVQAVAQLRRMIDAVNHESFYTQGMWIDVPLGVYVGWVAQKGSFSAAMPLSSERGDVVLMFSGEEFPEPGLVQRMKDRGHAFDSDGPAYLPHLYEEDPSFPSGLNGRFHGVLVDRNRSQALLFNDRYGMHRIYHHESRDAIYFAVEAKAILAVCPQLRSIDPDSFGDFVACGSVLGNRTLFKGLEILPPASAWVFQNGLLQQKGSYFHPKEWEDQEPLGPEDYYQELRRTFSSNLPRYFGGGQPTAMSLTGGLDTRMIMAWQKCQPATLPCYTFGGMLRDCQDVVVARQVAHECGQDHRVISVGKEFLSSFSHYAERAVYLTDGCVDVGRAPDLYLNEKARQVAPVRMTGNYGGEVFRSVRAFKPAEPTPGLFQPELLTCVRHAREKYAESLRCHPVSFAVFRQGPYHHYGILALEQTQLSLRSPYLDNDLVRTAFRAPGSALATNDVSLRLIADGNEKLLHIPTDRGLAGDDGPFISRARRALLEFQFKAEYAMDMGMPQWLARSCHVLSPFHFERVFLGRHKIFHFRIWYQNEIASYLKEMLLDSRSLSRPYLERRQLERLVLSHAKGERNYTLEIHKLLTMELLHRLFLDEPERGGIEEGRDDGLLDGCPEVGWRQRSA